MLRLSDDCGGGYAGSSAPERTAERPPLERAYQKSRERRAYFGSSTGALEVFSAILGGVLFLGALAIIFDWGSGVDPEHRALVLNEVFSGTVAPTLLGAPWFDIVLETTVIPEPTTALLLATGLGLLAGRRRRR